MVKAKEKSYACRLREITNVCHEGIKTGSLLVF